MAVTTNVLGTNTVVIEYTSGETVASAMNAIHDFMITKNWESLDAAVWGVGTDSWIRTYRIHNADGVSYKYVQFRGDATNNKFNMYVMQSYNPGTMTSTNIAQLSNSWAASLYFGQKMNLATGGQIYIAANNKWVVTQALTYAGDVGTTTGSSFFGCFETTTVQPECDPMLYSPHVWLCGYTSVMTYGTNYIAPASPPNTKTQTAIGAAQSCRIVTPLGAWGALAAPSATPAYGTSAHLVLPAATNPFNGKHNAFNLTLVYDAYSGSAISYVQGTIYGLKALSRGVGVLGDIIRIPVDTDSFADPAGINTDHLILTEGSVYTLRFAVPL